MLSAIMGIGMSSVLSTGILCSEKYIIITPKIIAAFYICSASLSLVLQAILGQFIVENPMLLFYLTVSILPLCFVLFSIATNIGEKILKDENETKPLISR